MFTYHTEKNRYGDEYIAVFANGAEIATIKASSHYGKAEYIASATDTNKADFTYFTCVFYKKGTCHIKFKPEAARIIDRLNIFAGQKKNWLPPTYGKKHYADMTDEEKAVIDDFQGEENYEKILSDPSMLISTTASLVSLPGM